MRHDYNEKRRTAEEAVKELNKSLKEFRDQFLAAVPLKGPRRMLSKMLGANISRINHLAAMNVSYARVELKRMRDIERAFNSAKVRGNELDPEKVRQIALHSPHSMLDVIEIYNTSDMLDAAYDVYVKGDKTRWQEVKAHQTLRWFET